MRHPDELQLQAYYDGALEEEMGRQVQAHLGRCSSCMERLRAWDALSLLVRQGRPAAESFAPEGEFWARLAVRLHPTRPATWPLVTYLPPFLLGAFGLLAEGLMSLALLAYALIGMGLIPPLAPSLAAWLSQALADPLLGSSLYAWLGWSSEEVIRALTGPLGAMGLVAQETILMLTIVSMLGMFLSLVVILYLSWAMCWSRTAHPTA